MTQTASKPADSLTDPGIREQGRATLKSHPPLKGQAKAPGLSEVTNTRPSAAVAGTGRWRERPQTVAAVAGTERGRGRGRPRTAVSRATGQRMFVLSHAPLAGVGVASRGRGRAKVSA